MIYTKERRDRAFFNFLRGVFLAKGIIHLFKIKDRKLALDVESDTLHLVDDIVWDYLSKREEGFCHDDTFGYLKKTYNNQDIKEAISEIFALEDKGQLWSEAFHRKNPNEPVVKALCLNVAHSCNLSCRYCFAGEGCYGGEQELMSVNTGKAAVDFLLYHAKGRKKAELDFFGGEPLLNMKVVEEVTSYVRKREKETGISFNLTITTNGLLLNDAIIRYLREENFSVVLSLDGRKEIHNKMRTYKNGKGSYEDVVAKLNEFVSQWGDSYYIRGTFTRFNRDFCKDVKHLHKLGYKNLSLEPAVSLPEEPWALSESDIPLLCEEYESLAEHYLESREKGEPYTFFHFEVDIYKGPCIYKRLSGCGAGEEYLAVTPTGDIFPCHQLIGEEKLRMGNVNIQGDFRKLPEKLFPPAGPLENECPSCWARYHCGGGCRAASGLYNKDFNKPYKLECSMQKKRLECALYIQAELSQGSFGS